MDNTLITLLRFAKKTPAAEVTWQTVSEALEPVYGFDLNLVDVLETVMPAYGEAFNEKRFELGDPQWASRKLLLSPIKGFNSIAGVLGAVKLDSQYTVEQFYNSMIKEIISELRITRTDWCKDILFPEEKEQQAAIEKH